MATSLTITRTNGNVPKTLAGEDHITGLVFYIPSTELDKLPAFKTEPIQALSSIEAAEAAGITLTKTNADGKEEASALPIRIAHYHLSEIYRLNPAVILYVGIFAEASTNKTPDFSEVKKVQNYAGGRIRQMGVWYGSRPLGDGEDAKTLQGVADALEAQAGELSIVYAPKVASIKQMSDKVADGKSRVSVVVSQAGGDCEASRLYKDKANTAKTTVSDLGTVMGLLSRAKVHQCIAWVKEFPTGISVPGFGDGTLLRDLDRADIDALDAKRYLFMVTQPGQAGSYMNDSHTMDSAISDYAAIESVRTMDKAVRGVRTYVVPELGGNVYVDAETGKLAAHSVAHLETTANHALEDMERAGELSGYKVEIDPEQDVASSSALEFVIKNVASPVVRHFKIKIGFAKTV